MADLATIALLQYRSISAAELVAEQLQSALNTRVALEQAKGVLAERSGVTPNEAFTVLRRYARGHGRRLSDVAAEVINGTLRDLT